MSRRGCKGFWRNESGATAALYALALPALVGVAGIGFDYAHLVSLDTELQNAADQAALAAATQLDGASGACERAIDAAATRLAADAPWLANEARFANDGQGLTLQTVDTSFAGEPCTAHPNVRFYRNESKDPASDNEDANYVEVELVTRRANFALTPVVGVFSSPEMTGKAMAGIQSAFCQIAPLMLCNPAEGTGMEFDPDSLRGVGLLLKAKGGGNSWVPGDFGFLAAGYNAEGSDDFNGNGAKELRRVLGQESPLTECIAGNSVRTEPGNMENVVNAFNTRFDIYNNTGGLNNNQLCGNGQCPPDANPHTDLLRPDNATKCGIDAFDDKNSVGWVLPPADRRYFPETATSTNLTPMGFPRDECHARAAPDCRGTASRFGDGIWNIDAFFRTNYGWNTRADWLAATVGSGLHANSSRYDVYRWQKGQITVPPQAPRAVTGLTHLKSHIAPICQKTPAATTERRKITAAVLNCTGKTGRFTAQPVAWVDLFLVEPAIERKDAAGNVRTGSSDIYVEIIGGSRIAGEGGSTGSVARSVPYLVE
jgi:Flp pilus assembly protein TadG